jgi:hypothetical protein
MKERDGTSFDNKKVDVRNFCYRKKEISFVPTSYT